MRASRNQTMSVSLVGYTNAGKSTLFNALTKAQAYAADQLFATLDTTSRRVYLGDEAGLGSWLVPIRSVSSANCLTNWLQLSAPRSRKPFHADLLLHVVDASSAVQARIRSIR